MADDFDQDRRKTVRVDERCLFGWQEITRQEYEKIAADYKKGISLYSQEKLADIRMITGAGNALARIREKDADLADFLAHLDIKINFLIKKMEGRQTLLDALKLQDISISAGGVAFESEESLSPGKIIELHILLLPEYVYIYSLGKIVDSQAVEDKEKYRNSLEFLIITNNDRDTIIKYSFSKQSRALRRQRLRK